MDSMSTLDVELTLDDRESLQDRIKQCLHEIRDEKAKQEAAISGIQSKLERVQESFKMMSLYMEGIKECSEKIQELQDFTSNAHLITVSSINACVRLLNQRSTIKDQVCDKVKVIESNVLEMESDLNQKSAELNNLDIDKLETRIKTILKEDIDKLLDKLRPGQLAEPSIPLPIRWESGRDLLFETSCYPRAVLVNEKVYVGGGITMSEKEAVVMCYNINSNYWFELPPYITHSDQYRYSSLAILNDELIMVGGENCKNYTRTSKVHAWNEDSRRWIERYHPMITPCDSPTVVTFRNRWLIVIGGRPGSLNDVQILDSRSSRWYNGAPLPEGCFDASAVTINDTCYIIGGCTENGKRVYCVNLDHLINLTSSPWQSLPDVPLERSTALAVGGALLAIGGAGSSSGIYLYDASTKTWKSAGQLPRARCDCACLLLPNRSIFITGGRTNPSKKLDIGYNYY